ncbi:MAG TPA: helix-turn-helix domain-containing protein [Candidatus Sulfotelmatobacter sp.]|jgi:transcriptional regulator with XRE-family HTH domain|nr:helix-turn-helix domain-containing protein [Candidatus Sulfotelmatobacter sp.]
MISSASESDISDLVLDLRRNLDVSQEGLARLLSISSRSVSRWEVGKGRPDKQIEERLHRLQKVVHELSLHLPKKLMVRWLSDRYGELRESSPVELLVNDFGAEAVELFVQKTFPSAASARSMTA